MDRSAMITDIAFAVVPFGDAAVNGRAALAAKKRAARCGKIGQGRSIGHAVDSTGRRALKETRKCRAA